MNEITKDYAKPVEFHNSVGNIQNQVMKEIKNNFVFEGKTNQLKTIIPTIHLLIQYQA